MPDSPDTVLRRHIRNALAQMRREIPPLQFRTATDVQAAEDRCVERLTQLLAPAAPPQASPAKRDPASTTGGDFGRAEAPRTRSMHELPPQPPRRTRTTGFGKETLHG